MEDGDVRRRLAPVCHLSAPLTVFTCEARLSIQTFEDRVKASFVRWRVSACRCVLFSGRLCGGGGRNAAAVDVVSYIHKDVYSVVHVQGLFRALAPSLWVECLLDGRFCFSAFTPAKSVSSDSHKHKDKIKKEHKQKDLKKEKDRDKSKHGNR